MLRGVGLVRGLWLWLRVGGCILGSILRDWDWDWDWGVLRVGGWRFDLLVRAQLEQGLGLGLELGLQPVQLESLYLYGMAGRSVFAVEVEVRLPRKLALVLMARYLVCSASSRSRGMYLQHLQTALRMPLCLTLRSARRVLFCAGYQLRRRVGPPVGGSSPRRRILQTWCMTVWQSGCSGSSSNQPATVSTCSVQCTVQE